MLIWRKFSGLDRRLNQYNVLVSKSLIQIKALLFNGKEGWREVRKFQKKEFKGNRGWFMRFQERNHLHNLKIQEGTANADVETAEIYPDLAEIMNVVTPNNKFFNMDKRAF